MTPSAQSERSEMSLALNTMEGPRNVTVVFNVLEMSVGVTSLHLPPVK